MKRLRSESRDSREETILGTFNPPGWEHSRGSHCAGITRRRGGMLIVVLVCLIIAAAILGSVLKLAAGYRRDQAAEQNRAQADWLAESGLERALHRLRSDPAYVGETWTCTPEMLNRRDGGEVTIRVEMVKQKSAERRVIIEAVFPSGTATPARRTKELTVPQISATTEEQKTSE